MEADRDLKKTENDLRIEKMEIGIPVEAIWLLKRTEFR